MTDLLGPLSAVAMVTFSVSAAMAGVLAYQRDQFDVDESRRAIAYLHASAVVAGMGVLTCLIVGPPVWALAPLALIPAHLATAAGMARHRRTVIAHGAAAPAAD